jgi:hypothetical protein
VIIPTFVNVKYTEENGYLTSQMQMYNDELNNILRNGLSDNGWTVPNQTQAKIQEIAAFTGVNAMPVGTMWYDSTNELMVFNLGGSLFTFTPVPWP